METELDLRGLYCPIPVLRTREGIEKVKVGDLLKVMADDPAAEEDLKRWAKRAGQEVVDVKKEGEDVIVTIRRIK
ncbi:MAG: sulfurtransferase TusA family protein [Candidatus Verstraetearchaeota archaeon]|nr:sulfurtransferase TusA family protein [Candidatus Verstraetearchaeota archaeon]